MSPASVTAQRLGLRSVGVLEDDEWVFERIESALAELRIPVFRLHSADEALEAAERSDLRFFVLDANLGEGRTLEGVDAVEKLKSYDSDISVGVLSRFREQFAEMALRAGADIFQPKSSDIRADVRLIVSFFLELQRRALDAALAELQWDAERQTSPNETTLAEREISSSRSEYRRLSRDEKWLRRYAGHYVAFVDGEQVAANPNSTELLEEIRRRFPTRRRFVVQATRSPRIVRVPTFRIVRRPGEPA